MQRLNDNNRGVGGGRRRDNAPVITYPTAEATVCLRANGIDNINKTLAKEDGPEDSTMKTEVSEGDEE